MFFVVNKYLLRKRFVGITLWPFAIMKSPDLKNDQVFINHEQIHLRQQSELLVLPFFLFYGLEYLYRLIQYKDRYIAYKNISFEREAYANEKQLDYLKERKYCAWCKYL